MKPPYHKPSPKSRKRRRGAKPGHPGRRRRTPERIDRRVEHRAKCCPDCRSRVKRCRETRTRYTEDIPDIQPQVTEHAIHRDWCPKCNKQVEPVVPDALPGATLGSQAVLMSIFRTLKQRGHDPIRTIVDALAVYLTTGQLPPLPETKATSDG